MSDGFDAVNERFERSLEEQRQPSLQFRSGRTALHKAPPPGARPVDRIQAMQAAVATLAGESQRVLEELRVLADPERSEVAELRAEVATLRQKVDALEGLMAGLAQHLLQDAGEHLAPETSDAPASEAPAPLPVYPLLRALQALCVDLPPEETDGLERPLQTLQSLHDRMEGEKQFEDRAGALVELVRARLLAGRSRDDLAQAQNHLLYVDLPDLLSRVEELAGRSTAETRRALEEFRRHVLDLVGLEEIAPRSGDPYDPARHNMLRVEATVQGAANTVASCYHRGLVLAADGHLVRKADVSVYP